MSQDSPIYQPSPWGQLYHSLKHDEALGAGAAGPGKTLVLLMEPLAQIVVEHERTTNPKHPHAIPPGSSTGWALSLRRTMPMIEQTIVRSHRIFPRLDPGARYDGTKHTWVFSSGYRYQFGHCKDPNDWEQYFSSEYSVCLFDELVQFLEEQYDQISGRVRSSDPVLGKMLKTRSMSNPTLSRDQMDNVSVEDPMWVRKRFVDPAPAGKVTLVKNITLASGEKIKKTRIYLPATLYDNPDPEFVRQYEGTLRDKKPHIQQALLYGNWYASYGSFFGDDWVPSMHVCKPFKIPDDWARFRSMDWGLKSPGCIHWWAMDPDGNLFCERELTFKGMTSAQVAARVKDIETDLGLWHGSRSRITGPADTQLWEKRGSSAVSMSAEFERAGVPWSQADKTSRSRNAGLLLARLQDHAKRTQTPGIQFFESCVMAIKTLPTILSDKNDPETPQDGGDDHWADSCLKADTYVTTWMGKVKLSEVGAGSLILSTDGLFHRTNGSRLTRRAAPVMRVLLEHGREIVGTPDHRILCHDGEWKRLDALDAGCYVFAPWIQSSSRQPASNSTAPASTSAVGTSAELRLAFAAACSSIARSTRNAWVRFLMATTSLIRTTIPPITWSAILSRYVRQSIAPGIFGRLSMPGHGSRISPRPEKRQRPGTVVPRGEPGTGSMSRNPSGSPEPSTRPAPAVASPSLPGSPMLGCALTPAEQRVVESLGLTMSGAFALPVGETSWRAGSRSKPPVLGDALRVVSVTPAGQMDVWCLDVPGMGAFVAEDVVVSNCYYACAFASKGRLGIPAKRTEMKYEDEPVQDRGQYGYGSDA